MAPPKPSETAGQPGSALTGLEQIFGGLRVEETLDEYQPRPGFGTSGKAIQVYANMFQARFNKKDPSVYHYDIDINPVVKVANQKKPRTLLWAIWKQLCAEAQGDLKAALDPAAYDGVKNVYTPVPLKIQGGKLDVIVALKEEGGDAGDDRRRFKVSFQYAQVIDLSNIVDFCKGHKQTELAKETMLVGLQAMNVLFRQDPNDKYTPIGAAGRRFFGTEGAEPIANGGMVYKGFAQSFRWTQSGLPAVQLDTAYSAFAQTGMFVDVAAQILGFGGGGGRGGRGGGRGFDRGGGGRGGRGGRGGPPSGGSSSSGAGAGAGLDSLTKPQIKRLNDMCRQTWRFTVTHRRTDRTWTMKGLTVQPASDIKFLLNSRDGGKDRMVGIVQYFKEQYNLTVTKPGLPCVQYANKQYVPMEFVKVLDFNRIPMRSLAAEQTADMIKVSAKPPPERAQMIRQWRQKLNYENLPKMRAWGVEVNKEMMKVEARVLPAPMIQYGGNKSLRAAFGGWNLKGVRFTKPGKPLKSWSVLSFDRFVGVPEMQKFVDYLCGVLQASGCPVENRRPECLVWNPDQGGPYQGIKQGLQEAARKAYMQTKANPQMVLIILPRKELMMYSEIKRHAAESLLKPVVTQCVQGAKLKQDRGMDQYCGNLSMKIHAKMGGVTHQVPIPQVLDKTTMMIGADVTHPPPRGGPVPPSIAVTVCATNGDNVQFEPKLRLQEGRVEIIQDLTNMVYSHIQAFERNTRAKPQKILMFRDGVSEGQYGLVVKNELKAIKDAARKFGGNYNPKVTFVICAKRHGYRFFAANDQDKDRTGNLTPGTVVDKGVTHPYCFDFFLQAHAGLQGTARPLHVVVVADENGFTADKMQNLCNNLSYTYARATRSVSMIPVAYYSDIIATRARDWVYSEDASDAAPSTTSDGRKENMEFDPFKLKKRIEDNADFNSVAWYM